jgi:hypothetical protein
MTTSDFIKSQIALACWRAARDELHHVMLSVCMVFLNRSQASGKDLYEEVTEYLEENTSGFPDTRDPQFQQLLNKLDTVTSGLVRDGTDGALWFVPKAKLETVMSPNMQITTTRGQMVFLR